MCRNEDLTMVTILTWAFIIYPIGFFLILLIRWRREIVEFNEKYGENITLWNTLLGQTYRVSTEAARADLRKLIRRRNKFVLLWWGVYFLIFLVFAMWVTLRVT